MKHLSFCLFIIAAALCAACSSDPKFHIEGEISGNPSMNIYVKYYTDGAVQTSVAAVRDGKFSIDGTSASPALVEILDNEYNVLARAYLRNGDKVSLKINRTNPYMIEAEGNELNKRWADAVRPAADKLQNGTPAQVNAFVEEYVARHPDDVVSTLIFLSCYDASTNPLRADSVLASIAAEARPGSLVGPWSLMARRCSDPASAERIDSIPYRVSASDSVLVYHPSHARATLLTFSDENSKRTDSVVPRLRNIRKAFPAKDSVAVMDFVLISDTSVYKRALMRDSADWTQAWVPGGRYARGIDRLAIPAIPFYIVADSTGRQLYRGRSADEARRVISKVVGR